MTNTQVEQVYTEVLTTGVSSGVVEQVYTEVVGSNVQAPTALVEDYAQVAYTSTAPATVALLEEYAQVASLVPALPAATEYPSTLTGNVLWLRAKDFGSLGTVGVWPDRSGLGNNSVSMTNMSVVPGATPSGGTAARFANGSLYFPRLPLKVSTVAASASSHWNASANSVDLLNDSLTSAEWIAGTNALPQWVQYQIMAGPTVVTGYSLRATSGNTGNAPGTWTIQGSNDQQTWTVLDTQTGQTPLNSPASSYTFSNSTAYRYYRMNITARAGGANEVRFVEWTLTGVASGAAVAGPGEIWMVVKSADSSGSAWRWGNGGSSNHYTFSGTVYDDFGATVRDSFAPTKDPTSAYRVLRIAMSSTGTKTWYLDGVAQGTVSGRTLDWNTAPALAIGWTGDHVEVLYRNQISTPTEEIALLSYFNTEHGLGLTFPTVAAGTVLARYKASNSSGVGTSPLAIADESGNGFDATLTTATVVSIAPFSVTAATVSANISPLGPDGAGNLAIDGNAGTYWTTPGTQTGWIRLQLSAASVVTSYAIRRRDDIPNRNATAWTFEGSNDGTTFTTLDTKSGITWPTSGQTQTFTFSNSTAYLYYRLNVTANGGDTYLSVAEISLSGGASNKAIRLAGGVWTILKTDFAVNTGSVSSTYGSGADGTWTGLIDGSVGTFWTTAGTQTGFVILQLPVARVATVYTITARNDGLASTRSAKDWTFAGSNDGSTWTTLDTRTSETGWTTSLSRSYTFTNTVAYAYYRLNVTANNGDTYLSFSGLTMGFIRTIWPATTEREMWLVVKSNSVGTASWVLGTSGASSIYPYTDNNIYDDSFITQRQQFLPTMSINVLRLYRLTFTGGAWTAYLDGVSQLAVTGKSAGENSNPRMGSAASIDYVEVLLRQQVSTPSEAADYITYFNTTYGLAVPGGSTGPGAGYGALPV